MLDTILEALDESIFTQEAKQQIRESFEDAVTFKAETLVEQKIEDLEIKSEEHIQALDEKSQEYLDELSTMSEEYHEYLVERQEAYVLLKEEELVERAEDYLDSVVQEFVEEARETMQESLAQKESEVLKEAFDAMISAQGKEYQKSILESSDDAIKAEIENLKESYNEAMKEVFSLKRENASLLKMGVISEMVSDMTIVEAERFERLAEGIEFTTDERYVRRLESLKESIKGHSRTQEPQQNSEELINENVDNLKPEQTKEESFGNLFSFNHLV